jgi:protein required for attachment to host cells
MVTTWILAADRAKARLFAFHGQDGFVEEVEDFVNPEGRGDDSLRDRLPRTQDRLGAGRHAIEPHTTPKQKAEGRFARELVAALERGRTRGSYRDLVLIAPPRFLGALNSALGEKVRAHVVAELPKDLTNMGLQQILAHLPERFQSPSRARQSPMPPP